MWLTKKILPSSMITEGGYTTQEETTTHSDTCISDKKC